MYKKLKNCTFTQTQLDINGGIGILIGFIIAKLWPGFLFLQWYVYAFSAITLSIPILLIIYKQFSDDKSLEQKTLSVNNIRWMK